MPVTKTRVIAGIIKALNKWPKWSICGEEQKSFWVEGGIIQTIQVLT